MKYEDVFELDFLKLPKFLDTSISFKKGLENIFDEYNSTLKKISDSEILLTGRRKTISPRWIEAKQSDFIANLYIVLETYLRGDPYNAYKIFDKCLNDRIHSYQALLKEFIFEPNENFYRLRLKKENFPLSKGEMFHIPFQDRGKVPSYRFSIPGFPTLYLSKTLYVAWEELKRPDLDEFQCVRLSSNNQIKCLDLTTPDLSDPYSPSAYEYFITWPLIAATSIKVAKPNDHFKPEYIFPQLLLQWIRNNKKLDGIKYNSTHLKYNFAKSTNYDLYNVVIPVKTNPEIGYCPRLIELFHSTTPISHQLLNTSTGGQVFIYSDVEFEKIDKKIPKLELIPGKFYPYSSSILGQMELYLDSLPVSLIDQK